MKNYKPMWLVVAFAILVIFAACTNTSTSTNNDINEIRITLEPEVMERIDDDSARFNTALACELLKMGNSTGPYNPEGIPEDVLDWSIGSAWPSSCREVGVDSNFDDWCAGIGFGSDICDEHGGGGGGSSGGSGGSSSGGSGGGSEGTGSQAGELDEDELIALCEHTYDPTYGTIPGPLQDCALDVVQNACSHIASCYSPSDLEDVVFIDSNCIGEVINEIEQGFEACFVNHADGIDLP